MMDATSLERLSALACGLAHEAGIAILTVYEREVDVLEKEDRTPLTEADLLAHQHIETGLLEAGPFPVLSEESSKKNIESRAEWETYWLVDPLDGTREFLKRNGEFTVNIALIHRHEPVIGVVHAPVSGEIYFAHRGSGSFKCRWGEPAKAIRTQCPPSSPLRVLGSRSHASAAFSDYLPRLGTCELTSVGSSLKFLRVAEGLADLYPRLGPTSEWDTAAAQCVLVEAGGAVVDLQGAPLRYNTRETLLNPFFLAYGDPAVSWPLDPV